MKNDASYICRNVGLRIIEDPVFSQGRYAIKKKLFPDKVVITFRMYFDGRLRISRHRFLVFVAGHRAATPGGPELSEPKFGAHRPL